jgi:hypothetical protein
MLPLVSLTLQLALGLALPVWVIRRDLRRLPANQLARAWNDATVWSAVAAFGPLALIVYFARTRRSLRGFGLGLFWAVASLAAAAAAGWLASP